MYFHARQQQHGQNDCFCIGVLIADQRTGLSTQVLSNLVSGIILAFYHSWALALITLATLPVTAIGFWFQLKSLNGFSKEVIR